MCDPQVPHLYLRVLVRTTPSSVNMKVKIENNVIIHNHFIKPVNNDNLNTRMGKGFSRCPETLL